MNEAFFKHRTTGLPFVIAKFAASPWLGRSPRRPGDSRWVSGPETREWSHRLRTRIDAILVGSSTVVIDDPLLTARPNGIDAPRQPLRIVVDTRGRVPPMSQLFTGPAKTLVATSDQAPADWRASRGARRGSRRLPLAGSPCRSARGARRAGQARRISTTLLVEGGGVVLGSFFDAGLVDKLHAVIAPMIVGAADAPAAVAGEGADTQGGRPPASANVTVERLGEDISSSRATRRKYPKERAG